MEQNKKPKIKIIIDGQEFEAEYRSFKEGKSHGYGLYGRIKLDNYPYRISMNIIEV